MEKPKRGPGRPPLGLGKKGEPERIRDYPRLLFSLRPVTVTRLRAMSEHEGVPAWRIVDAALEAYFHALPASDRRAIEVLVREA